MKIISCRLYALLVVLLVLIIALGLVPGIAPSPAQANSQQTIYLPLLAARPSVVQLAPPTNVGSGEPYADTILFGNTPRVYSLWVTSVAGPDGGPWGVHIQGSMFGDEFHVDILNQGDVLVPQNGRVYSIGSVNVESPTVIIFTPFERALDRGPIQ